MTPDQIAEGKRLCEAATPGLWWCPTLFKDTITVIGATNVGISAYSTIVSVHPLEQNDGEGREWQASGDMEANRQLIAFLRNHATDLLSAAERCGELERAIEDEPELPGDMPDEMWEAVQEADRETMTEILRACVRTTKAGILRATLRHDGERGETTTNPPRREE